MCGRSRRCFPNLDWYSAGQLPTTSCGIPTAMFNALCSSLSRVTGWSAHVHRSSAKDGKIIPGRRPHYNIGARRTASFVPIAQRPIACHRTISKSRAAAEARNELGWFSIADYTRLLRNYGGR